MGGIIYYMTQFSDTTNNSGLIQRCEFTLFGDNGFGEISGNTNRLQAFTNLLNSSLDKVTNLIMQCDGRWQYDATNYTDLPIGRTDLVAGQQDYGLSATHLKIVRVEVLDAQGIWVKLEPVDVNEIEDSGMVDYLNTPATPRYYDTQGESIFLYPKPQTGYVTLGSSTGGLKLYFQRGSSYFDITDTTKEPGFASTFHRLVERWACYDYALNRQIPIAKALRDEITILEQELQDHYNARQPDDPIQFRIRPMTWN